MALEDYLTKFDEAQDADELYRLLEQALENLCGYDRVIFSLMSDHCSIGLKAGHGVMRNYPDEWMKHYIQKGYEHVDPVRRFGFSQVGPFIWDSLPLVTRLTSQQTKVMAQCREAGFYNGAALCLRGLTGELGGVGVASSSQKLPDSEKEVRYKLRMLNVISQQFYVSFYNMHERITSLNDLQVMLTGREFEVIRHMALAHKDDMIAFDLNMTRHTVDYHVRNILKKFKVHTRMAAVMRAVNAGVISLDDAPFIRIAPQTRQDTARTKARIQ